MQMRTYKVAMVHPRLNTRLSINVKAFSCSEAGGIARKLYGTIGYCLIESIKCIGWRKENWRWKHCRYLECGTLSAGMMTASKHSQSLMDLFLRNGKLCLIAGSERFELGSCEQIPRVLILFNHQQLKRSKSNAQLQSDLPQSCNWQRRHKDVQQHQWRDFEELHCSLHVILQVHIRLIWDCLNTS